MRVFKRLSFGIIGVMLALMISAAPVFATETDDKTTEAVTTEASSKESEEKTTEEEKTTARSTEGTETKAETAAESTTAPVTSEESEEKPPEPTTPAALETVEDFEFALTPYGNMTLVDDFITSTGKQFITVVTKEGNYFYLIIDRDADGNKNVHFLNQVDERDLLALMDEKEASAVEASLAAVRQEKEKAASESATWSTKESEVSDPDPEKKESNKIQLMTIIAVIGTVVIVGVIFFVKKKNGKGPSANNGSRSGTEYQMEDDYYDDEEPEEDPEY